MIIESETFCHEVETLYAKNDINMFEAIFIVCDKYNIDYEYVGPLVNRSIKEKLKQDAIKIKLMKSDSYSLF